MPTTIKATTAGDFLAAVPSMLGFHPRDSLVVVAFAGTRSLGAMRIDIPPTEHSQSAANAIAGVLCKLRGADAFAAIVYSDATVAESLSGHLEYQARACGLALVDLLYVLDSQWGRVGSADLEPIPAPPEAIAHFHVDTDQSAGVNLPLVSDALQGDVASFLEAHRAGESGATIADAFFLAEQTASQDPAELAAADAASLIELLNRPAVRDMTLILWCRGRTAAMEALDAQLAWQAGHEYPSHLASTFTGHGPTPDVNQLRAVLEIARHLAALAPERYRSGPLAVAAWLSWALGRSTHADAYAHQALTLDPNHGFAGIVTHLVDQGLPEWALRG